MENKTTKGIIKLIKEKVEPTRTSQVQKFMVMEESRNNTFFTLYNNCNLLEGIKVGDWVELQYATKGNKAKNGAVYVEHYVNGMLLIIEPPSSDEIILFNKMSQKAKDWFVMANTQLSARHGANGLTPEKLATVIWNLRTNHSADDIELGINNFLKSQSCKVRNVEHLERLISDLIPENASNS